MTHRMAFLPVMVTSLCLSQFYSSIAWAASSIDTSKTSIQTEIYHASQPVLAPLPAKSSQSLTSTPSPLWPDNQSTPLTPAQQPLSAKLQMSVPSVQQLPVAVPVAPEQTQASLRNLVIPPNTVLNIKLNQDISSKDSQLGEDVTAVVKNALFLGPYTVIPEGALLNGQIVQINRKNDKEGHHPYVVVLFDQIKMSTIGQTLPFHATMIAYKTGLNDQDYIWKLPNPEQQKKKTIGMVMGGAFGGMLLNPIFGPPIGAGMALTKHHLDNADSRRGVKIKANDVLPIAIDQEITLPVMMAPLHRINTAEKTNGASIEKEVSYQNTGTVKY